MNAEFRRLLSDSKIQGHHHRYHARTRPVSAMLGSSIRRLVKSDGLLLVWIPIRSSWAHQTLLAGKCSGSWCGGTAKHWCIWTPCRKPRSCENHARPPPAAQLGGYPRSPLPASTSSLSIGVVVPCALVLGIGAFGHFVKGRHPTRFLPSFYLQIGWEGVLDMLLLWVCLACG